MNLSFLQQQQLNHINVYFERKPRILYIATLDADGIREANQ